MPWEQTFQSLAKPATRELFTALAKFIFFSLFPNDLSRKEQVLLSSGDDVFKFEKGKHKMD